MYKITVFTPTYNRAYTLTRAYESMRKQSCKDFVWLIIDDGSEDNTRELVESWLHDDNEFKIRYYYKENGGMHTAHNMAFDKCDTELIFCLDSDDDLTDDAIESILATWSMIDKEIICGIVANEQYRTTKSTIGSDFPSELELVKFFDIYHKHGVRGDKVLIYKSNIIKMNEYPSYIGEKFVPLCYKYYKISEPLAVLNKSIMNKEYLDDGYTKNILKVYAKNPAGFAFAKKNELYLFSIFKNPIKTIKTIIHYIGTSSLAGYDHIIIKSPHKVMSFILYPLGILWYLKLKSVKKDLNKLK